MKKFWTNPWTITIGGVLLSFALSVLRDLVKGIKTLSTVKIVFSAIWRAIIAFLNFDLKVWWVLIGIAVILAILWIVLKRDKENEEKLLEENKRPDFTSYTEDHFRTWKWSWEWKYNTYMGEWNVDNLKAHCPKCDTPMQHDLAETAFECPRCQYGSYYEDHEVSSQVKAVIIDNIKRKQKAVHCYET